MSDNFLQNEIFDINKNLNKIDDNNKEFLSDTTILKLKDLIEQCKKYPMALIVVEQQQKENLEKMYVELCSYPAVHFINLTPIYKIKANEHVIVLYSHTEPILEEFNMEVLESYDRDYLTAERLLIKHLKESNEAEMRMCFDMPEERPLLNEYMDKGFLNRNNWKNSYNCEKTIYLPVYHSYESLVNEVEVLSVSY